jgi:hypothetical protein
VAVGGVTYRTCIFSVLLDTSRGLYIPQLNLLDVKIN